mmetsp:Transcript_149401/g.260520  ORF Transcript_149401/g.260520 Transcript_149401/m.260520 type:complete len:719 (-) Transcript_149401:24-2180(-)
MAEAAGDIEISGVTKPISDESRQISMSDACRATFPDLLEELRRHGKDVSGISPDGITKETLAKMLLALMDVNEEIMKDMDASTKIAKLPMAWCNASLSWKGVNFTVKDTEGKERAILKDCSGHVPAGSLVAVMGPSGCGKSTLVDILAKKKTTAWDGAVYCNGHDVKGDPFFTRYATYVPQSDSMHEVLTVKETIFFDFALKNPPPKQVKIDPQLRDKLPSVILSVLGLTQVENTMIGGEISGKRGISGGQKRRVTLARGAISGAQLLFADEPTSGLSATDAETCIRMLRFLCKRVGLTCLVVIHQPRSEVAALFDQLILLTANPGKYGGSVVYNGPMSANLEYCGQAGYPVPDRANPADWLMDMVSPGYKHILVKQNVKKLDQSVEEFVKFYKESRAPIVESAVDKAIAEPGRPPIEEVYSRWERMSQFMSPDVFDAKQMPKLQRQGKRYATSWPMQFLILLNVKLKLLARDAKGLRMKMGMSIFQAIIVGIAFQDIASKPQISHVQFLFMAMQMAAMSGMQVMPQLVDARNVMKKDVSEGLHSISAWIVANCVPDALITVITQSIFIVILYAFGGMEWSNFGLFYGWVLLLLLCMDSYFNFIAAVAKTSQLATVMAMPLMMMFILFNGFLVSRSSAPDFMVWALYVSPFMYTITSLSMALYGPDACSEMGCKIVISTYGFDEGPSSLVSIIVLIALFVVFRTLQIIGLSMLNKPEK